MKCLTPRVTRRLGRKSILWIGGFLFVRARSRGAILYNDATP
jgi:hypothetical protein